MTEFQKATRQEIMDHRVPLHVRDACSGVLIPLNQ